MKEQMSEPCCVIFAGSPERGVPCLTPPDAALTLCADSGLRLARALGREPDCVLGDFDSLGGVPENLRVLTAPREKDDTDTLLAVRYALEQGFRKIQIFGAFGGRADHSFANLQLLDFLLDHGASGLLVGAGDFAVLQDSARAWHYPKKDGFSLSLFSWSERCEGVCTNGLRYPLCGGTLYRNFPRGVSNEITQPLASVQISRGRLLVMGSRL